ncbi:hypothetical protein FOZ63_013042, partial [Perkinsus olseni]
MAFVRTKKGNWDGVYEPSASVLNSLGKITAVQKKGHNASIKDLSTEELVDIMEESFLSLGGPLWVVVMLLERLLSRSLTVVLKGLRHSTFTSKVHLYADSTLADRPNPPYDSVIMSLPVEGYSVSTGENPAPEVGEDPIPTLAGLNAQSPFITLKSKLADEEQLMLMNEGKDELENKMNFLVRKSEDLSLLVEEDPPAQGGKDKKGAAAEGEAKEGKSDVEMEVLFPRFTITLTGTPKKGSPAEGHEGETYVGEVVVGAKLSGRLTRGKPYVSEEERERLEEERIAKEKEDKKNKKGKAKKGAAAVPEEPPMIKQYSWEVGNRGGVAIDDVMEDAPPGEEGTPPAVPMTDLWG